MSKIKVGDKVRVEENLAGFGYHLSGLVGEVVRMYDLDEPIAVVRFPEDCITSKVPVSYLVKVEPQPEKVEEPKEPIQEDGVKLISYDQFMSAAVKAASLDKIRELTKDDSKNTQPMLMSISAIQVATKLAMKIFAESTVVPFTKDELYKFILLSPCGEETEFFIIAITASMILKDMVEELFPDVVDNA